MSAERNDGPIAEIVLFKKRKERHGQRAPPVRIPDEHRVVAVQRRQFRGNGRAGVRFLFLLCLVHHSVVVFGIGFHGFQFHQVAAHALVNEARKTTRVAAMRKIHDEHLSSSRFRGQSPRGKQRGRGQHGGPQRKSLQKNASRCDADLKRTHVCRHAAIVRIAHNRLLFMTPGSAPDGKNVRTGTAPRECGTLPSGENRLLSGKATCPQPEPRRSRRPARSACAEIPCRAGSARARRSDSRGCCPRQCCPAHGNAPGNRIRRRR